ncbi:MAG: ABC transporter permease [Bacillota bacterium]|nr:ABC transporter permease [Bacillota bacterium]
MKKSINTLSKAYPAIAFLLLLLIWELLVQLADVPAFILPPPSQVMIALIEGLPLLLNHTGATLMEAGLGFTLSILIAFLIGFLLDNIVWLRQTFYPLIIVSQTIPLITLALLFAIWFGFGIFPKILVVILVCFFPIVISLMSGLDSVDYDQIQLFRSMGAGKLEIFTMVKVPAAMPAFFSGVRISATYSIMAAIIGEWMGATKGLGYFMTIAQKSYRIDQVLAAVVLICLLSLLMVLLVDLLEYLLLPWNRCNDHVL